MSPEMNADKLLVDTDRETERFRLSLIAGLSPEERFARQSRLCAFAKLAMLEGLRQLHPDFTEAQLKIALARSLWGSAFAQHIARRAQAIDG